MNVLDQQRVGSSWQGSVATVRADESFEPNFRHFDFFLEPEVPDSDIVNRVFKVESGKVDYDMASLFSGQSRAVPVVVTSIGGGVMVNYVYTRLLSKTAASLRWTIVPSYLLILAWNNITKFYGRERHFKQDWQRNQSYALDELRQKRNEQRVREALYAKNFVTNPLAEYRIKSWQLSERFA